MSRSRYPISPKYPKSICPLPSRFQRPLPQGPFGSPQAPPHRWLTIVRARRASHASAPGERHAEPDPPPLIVGQTSVLPKHWWEGRDFESTILDPLLGSGPYRITAVEPGRSITLERVPDYRGRNLPVNRGQNNIDVIRYDCYRNATVAVEAFKAGELDFRSENNSKEWGTAYDIPDVANGRMI